MMKKLWLLGLLLELASFTYAQDFEFPPVGNDVQSIKNSFFVLMENSRNSSFIEWGSDWTSSEVSINKKYTGYLDAVLKNMSYDQVKKNVADIRTAIQGIDPQNISRSQQGELDRFLANANITPLLYITGIKFPRTIELDYDKTELLALENQKAQNEQRLIEYQTELKTLPSADDLRAKIAEVQAQIKAPENQRNNQRLQALENQQISLGQQLANLSINRQNYTQAIRSLESNLQNYEIRKTRLEESARKDAEDQYIQNLWTKLNSFYEWEAFFRNENSCVRDYLILIGTKAHLISLVEDELPQRQSVVYKTKLDDFLGGWEL